MGGAQALPLPRLVPRMGPVDQLLVAGMARWAIVLQPHCLLQLAAAYLPTPHLVVVLAYDLGWGDSAICVPQLDALGVGSEQMERYYMQPLCTPSCSQFLSGCYQVGCGVVVKGENSGRFSLGVVVQAWQHIVKNIPVIVSFCYVLLNWSGTQIRS